MEILVFLLSPSRATSEEVDDFLTRSTYMSSRYICILMRNPFSHNIFLLMAEDFSCAKYLGAASSPYFFTANVFKGG